MVLQKKVRKILNLKLQELNDIIADIDHLVSEMETDFFRVCIFGSARISENSPIYHQAYDLAFNLSQLGVDIVTGGGPGLMEAANKGAKDGSKQSRSIGLAIQLPFESDANSHLDVKHSHKRFSSRLDEFMRISHAVVMTAGGVGTFLELFYTWQLMQVNHIQKRPFILLGREFWQGLVKWIEEKPLKNGLMSQTDMDMFQICDSVEEAVEFLKPYIKTFRDQTTK